MPNRNNFINGRRGFSSRRGRNQRGGSPSAEAKAKRDFERHGGISAAQNAPMGTWWCCNFFVSLCCPDIVQPGKGRTRGEY